MGRFNRTNFFPSEVVNGRNERDLVKNYFNDLFIVRRPMRFYIIKSTDVARPDLLSIKFYGQQDYWWIVCRVNKLDDPWNDIIVGDIIQIPALQDINDFFQAVRSQLVKGTTNG